MDLVPWCDPSQTVVEMHSILFLAASLSLWAALFGLVRPFSLSPRQLLERHQSYPHQFHSTVTTDESSQSSPSKRHNRAKPCRWYTCSSSNELVQAISSILQPDDVVVEIGAQLRGITASIVDAVPQGGVLCMDVQRRFPTDVGSTRTRVMRTAAAISPLRSTHDTFVEMECLDDWRSTVLSRPFYADNTTVLVLDINSIVGNDLDWTSFSILREFTNAVPTCRAVLVKSKLLHQWSHRILHAEHWIHGSANGPTTRSTEVVRSPKVIATVGVQQYRRTIPRTVQPGDTVLEVGCHCGTTTQLLYEASSNGDEESALTLGVDVGPRIVKSAQKRYPNGPSFAVGDAWKAAQLLRLQHEAATAQNITATRIGFDVIYVDIGGLSGENGLMEALVLLHSLQSALEPRCIVIKSACVQQLSTMLVPYNSAMRKRH